MLETTVLHNTPVFVELPISFHQELSILQAAVGHYLLQLILLGWRSVVMGFVALMEGQLPHCKLESMASLEWRSDMLFNTPIVLH